jgi:hypothetical protein
LLAKKPTGTLRTLKGLDLKTGGEWAKALYDRAIPNFMNKYLKKYGVRVGSSQLGGTAETLKPTETGGGYWILENHDGTSSK